MLAFEYAKETLVEMFIYGKSENSRMVSRILTCVI